MFTDGLFITENVIPSVLLLVLCILFVKLFQQRKPNLYNCLEINGPPVLPLIGSSYVLQGGTRKILENIVIMVEKYKPICKVVLGYKPMFFLARPEDVQVVLNKCLEREEGYRFIRPVFGYGLFTRPVRSWRGHRKTIVSTFSQQILNSFVDIFNEYSEGLVAKLKGQVEDGYFDCFPVLTQCTLDIMCSSVMGTKMNAMKEESQFIIWMTKVAELSILRMFHVYLWPDFIWNLFPISKESHDLDQKIQNYVSKVIENKRQKRWSVDQGKKIFLDHLLELTDHDGAWNDDELTNETRSVIMAGSDATAITLSYCLVMLAMFQEVQSRAYEELYEIFGESDRDVDVEDLAKMQYLDRFIKETLRMFPVTSTIGRELTQDVTLGKYTLPKGTSIGIPIFYIHRCPEYWPSPLKFDPDRFLPEEVAKRHPCTYLPFSYGPRNCIGFKYATMVMKVILSTVLRNFKVAATSYPVITDLKVKMDIATKCDEGYPVRLEVRQHGK